MDILYGTPPPASAKQWIRIIDVGPHSYPPAVVWIFPDPPGEYDRFGQEYVVAVSRKQYNSLVDFVRANRCSTDIGMDVDVFTKQVSEYSNGKVTALCVLPCEKVHPYMVRMMAALGINPASAEAKSIRMADRTTCELISVPSSRPIPE